MKYNFMAHKYDAIVIGGSAGSFSIITKILNNLPTDFPLPIFITLHRLKDVRSGLKEALEMKSSKPIVEPEDKQYIQKGQLYLAPSNYHMCVELGNTISLSTEPLKNNSRPAIDLTFETAAYLYRERTIGILLSGANKDGALGMKKIKQYGGITIIQSLSESMIDTMPKAAKNITEIDYELLSDEIIEFLTQLNEKIK